MEVVAVDIDLTDDVVICIIAPILAAAPTGAADCHSMSAWKFFEWIEMVGAVDELFAHPLTIDDEDEGDEPGIFTFLSASRFWQLIDSHPDKRSDAVDRLDSATRHWRAMSGVSEVYFHFTLAELKHAIPQQTSWLH